MIRHLLITIALLSFGAQASEPRVSEANYPKLERFMLTVLCVNSGYLPARVVRERALALIAVDPLAYDIYRKDKFAGVLIYAGPEHAAELTYRAEQSIYYPAATAQMCISMNQMSEKQYESRR